MERRERAEEAEREFRERTAKAAAPSEWGLFAGDPVEAVTTTAHYADLTIVGQTDPDDGRSIQGLADSVVLGAGGPVLVWPRTVETELGGCRALAVAAGGAFRGRADVETAEISGTREGSLRVRGTLTVHAAARILSEPLSYAEIEIERGGMVTGGVQSLPEDAE